MKNVLVLHSHNFSAFYLTEQELKHELAPNFDSTRVFEPSQNDVMGFDANKAAQIREGLQSADGEIQYWHFKHAEPRHNPEKPPTNHHIEYWVEKLKENLPPGETLDALVLPTAYESETPQLLDWIRDLKKQFPNLKVIKHNPMFTCSSIESEKARRFVWPLNSEAGDIPGIRKLILTESTDDYQMADCVDVVAHHIEGSASADLLRQQLELPPLPQQERGRL